MKTKFINVWDNIRCGYIGFIVLQVEETDKFLVDKNFNPGYKFVIQAWYNNVGAAGGHTFIPSYGEGIQEKSKKIETNEADVFGLYLSNIKDIYDIPDELDTKNFWGIMNTKRDYNEVDEEEEYPCDEYYKVAFKKHMMSFNKRSSLLENSNELFSEILDDKQIIEMQDSIKKMKNKMTKMKVDLDQESYQVYYGYVNKETLELKGVYFVWGTDSNYNVINRYLWIPNTEMPKELWNKVKKTNHDNDNLSIYDELYY